MEYLVFSFWFVVIHTVSYTIAGMVALKLSKDLYEEKNRLLDYLRDMSDENESKHVTKWFLPIQLIRGLVLSIVLYPILALLGELSFFMRLTFFSGLMFFYTDFACAVPFLNNLEGFVYMKERYVKKRFFGKLYLETIIYSLLVGLFVSWFLF